MDDNTPGDVALLEFQQRTLWALQDVARFVDLANEPDTTRWYAERLRELASPLIVRLVPMVTFLYCAPPEAEWAMEIAAIRQGGTFALAKWCKRWKIAAPKRASFQLLATPRSEEEQVAKAEVANENLIALTDRGGWELRNAVYGAMALRMMLDEDLPVTARSMVYWLLVTLRDSPFADILVLSKVRLPGEVNQSAVETLASYRVLYERGFIERVDDFPKLDEDDLVIRFLLFQNQNGSKHPVSYRDEVFGCPGLRYDGAPIEECEIQLQLPESLAKAAERWLTEDNELGDLRRAMQEQMGEARVFVEHVGVGRSHESRGVIGVRLFCSINEDEDEIAEQMTAIAEAWLRERLIRRGACVRDR